MTFTNFLTDPTSTCLAYLAAYFQQHPQAEVKVSQYDGHPDNLLETRTYEPIPWADDYEEIATLTETGATTEGRTKNGEERPIEPIPYAELRPLVLITCCQVIHRATSGWVHPVNRPRN